LLPIHHAKDGRKSSDLSRQLLKQGFEYSRQWHTTTASPQITSAHAIQHFIKKSAMNFGLLSSLATDT